MEVGLASFGREWDEDDYAALRILTPPLVESLIPPSPSVPIQLVALHQTSLSKCLGKMPSLRNPTRPSHQR